jgi:microcystin-dependent protein
MAETTHRGIPFPGSPTTEAPKICSEFEKLAKFFDNDAETKEGTAAERTAWETSGKKQVRGRLFFVSTAGSEYGMWWDNGTTWIYIGGFAGRWETGDLKLSAAASLPSGWLKCEGQEVSRTTYAALFAAIGTTYGVGNGSTTFNVPNYIERVPMGPGATNKLGAKLGASTVTLTAAQSGLREHDHEMFSEEAGGAAPNVEEGKIVGDTSGGGSDKGLANNYTGAFKFRIGVKAAPAQNAAESHTNIQPSTVCNVWIKT